MRNRVSFPLGSAALLLAGFAATGAAAQQPAKAAPPLVFDRVTVVDVEHGRLLPRQRVVVVGNHIQAVGASGAIATPAGARVIDGRGKYLIPGLWDMHVHPWGLVQTFYPLLLANGITGIRDPKSEEKPWTPKSALLSLDSLLAWQRAILAGTRVGPPRQLFSGPHVPTTIELGLAGLSDTAGEVAARRFVDSLKTSGATTMEEYSFKLNYRNAAAVVDEARRIGLLVGGHVDNADAMTASDSGARIIDHFWLSAGGLDTLCWGPQASVARCQPVAEHFQRNGTWWIPTFDIYFYLAPYSDSDPDWARLLGPGSQAIMERFEAFALRYWAGEPVTGDWLHDVVRRDAATNPVRSLRIARQAGIPILAGTDTYAMPNQQSPRYVPPGFSLQAELALFVAAGLTPLEALQTATLNPAKLLRATDSLGTVAAGKLADLVLLDADPLTDIANLGRVRAVVANGRYYDRAALDHLLAVALMQGKRDFNWFGEVH